MPKRNPLLERKPPKRKRKERSPESHFNPESVKAIGHFWDFYYESSGKLSDICRYSNPSIIIALFFSYQQKLPSFQGWNDLYAILSFLSASAALFADLLQYQIQTFNFKRWVDQLQVKLDKDPSISLDQQYQTDWNALPESIFDLKIRLTAFAFGAFIFFVLGNAFSSCTHDSKNQKQYVLNLQE